MVIVVILAHLSWCRDGFMASGLDWGTVLDPRYFADLLDFANIICSTAVLSVVMCEAKNKTVQTALTALGESTVQRVTCSTLVSPKIAARKNPTRILANLRNRHHGLVIWAVSSMLRSAKLHSPV